MIIQNQKLDKNIFNTILEKLPTRDGFGKGLVEVGEQDERVVALCADLAESTRVQWFKERFPKRYIEIGVAEQNLATVAAGLAEYGKIPFITSYATFSPGRNNEQIRTTIALNDVPVKVIGCHAGISVGPDGATHQALEDIALMRVQPNMTVVVPCDAEEARKATHAIAFNNKPSYLRLGRSGVPAITTTDSPFTIGKANILWESENPQVALIACGALVHTALVSAQKLAEEGIGSIVVNNHTVKPIDIETVTDVAKRCGAVVTLEEHQVASGMGSAVAEVLAQHYPVPVEFIGVHDQFGQSGELDELMKHYGMDIDSAVFSAKKVVHRSQT